MKGYFKRYFTPLLLTGDWLLFNLSFLCVYFFYYRGVPLTYPHYLVLPVAGNVVFFVLVYLFQAHRISRTDSKSATLQNTWKVLLVFSLVFEAAFHVLGIGFFSLKFLLSFYALLAIVFSFWRFGVAYLLELYRKSGYNYRNVIIAGYGKTGEHLVRFFEDHPRYSYRFLGFFDDHPNGGKATGSLDDIDAFLEANEVDEIYCSTSQLTNNQIMYIMDLCNSRDIQIKLLPDLEMEQQNLKVDFYGSLPVLSTQPIPLDNVLNSGLKRAFDIVFSLLVIVLVLSWLIPVLALLIWLDSTGPAFFRQKRTGIRNKTFWCYKLRTMKVANVQEELQASPDDKRITGLGRFLRKTNLDEYPQFLNVLLGDMSIVGPRPHMIEHTQKYAGLVDHYMVRHFIKPGITGLSQIKGFRGETVNPILMESRIREDIFYMQNWTFLLDLKIILLTVLNMAGGEKNAY